MNRKLKTSRIMRERTVWKRNWNKKRMKMLRKKAKEKLMM
jgi:hypothetical protein